MVRADIAGKATSSHTLARSTASTSASKVLDGEVLSKMRTAVAEADLFGVETWLGNGFCCLFTAPTCRR